MTDSLASGATAVNQAQMPLRTEEEHANEVRRLRQQVELAQIQAELREAEARGRRTRSMSSPLERLEEEVEATRERRRLMRHGWTTASSQASNSSIEDDANTRTPSARALNIATPEASDDDGPQLRPGG
ncbi:hypothetical protein HDU93_006380, partial [Gonapodya sp. JEL0774]